ncbi:ubiquitin carboxyl-terminal hydrolase family protein, putative [Ichthyophthirius multifiliis]|uniref:Ubiquitin carboxyl-terminal hydrolase family protein, putative n=1 Tax=Ichthyophthirius multifiliis TaxID=5932 RepID=G0R1Q4_ICHMU|nr:ubiquitin carboxyl-terminal hydrolase family protein, putative [Ichthyophthirius multifiliis]EGR28599.1 ubiquitin carboxyl-terminal hydrolase family protein, putative [Ichthyophthirius multifiliis]|eukprot:XP_004029835.1 ubiquitin carboxyl-terminal hydrolase family protein, putative [Ichthyophthirius multifiliis]
MNNKELKQNNLYQQKNECNYVGLLNIGATCYMNSVLQTLFMTPEFRENIYKWKFDSNEVRAEDCIPLQLQILFAKMQLKTFPYIDTNDLAQSFGWDFQESWEQHDIQEFIRILLEAIEKSFVGSNNQNFINDIYEGASINYVQCQKCNKQSIRQENFLDLVVTVKNMFDKVYNDSLEKSIQSYIKPELLYNDNQYYCENCQQKVNALRGTKFCKLPKILSFILNRFTFDFESMKRIKLDDFVSFPFILNMNNYINGYENIKHKLNEETDEQYFKQNFTIMKKKNIQKTLSGHQKIQNTIQSAQKNKKYLNTGPSNQTKQFMKNLRNKNNNNINNNQIPQNIEDTEEAKTNPAYCILDQKQQTQKQTEDDEDLNERKNKFRQKSRNSSSKKNYSSHELSQNHNNNIQEEKSFEDYKKILLEHLQKNQQESQQLINQYLKDGPLVYELYSILIHSGGAYGGHYYAYIKSFEDNGKWHAFNDTSIMEIDVNEIPERVFGGNSTNAYMLFYRQWEDNFSKRIQKVDEGLIQDYVREMIEKQKNKWEEEQNFKLEQQKIMSVKVYYILNVKVIQIKSTDSYNKLLDQAIQLFKIKEKKENLRLRRYKPNTDQMLESFTESENLNLEKLKINNFCNLCIESKKDDEVFEDYDANTTYIKIVIWKPNIVSLDDNMIEYIKLNIRKNITVYRLMEQIARVSQIQFEKVCIIKRIDNIHGISSCEIISISQNYDYRIEDIDILEGSILYVEKNENIMNNKQNTKWQKVFEIDQNKISIKFNTPEKNTSNSNIEYNNYIIIDSRLTMLDLKNQIIQQIKVDSMDDIIMRRGGKAGIELKDTKKTINSMNFSNNSSIYLEFGKPAKEGEIRVLFYLAYRAPAITDNIWYSFQEIGEIPINGNLKASEVIIQVCQYINLNQNLNIEPQFIRLREKVSDNLTRIYREKTMREQQLIEKRAIALEYIENQIQYNLKDYLIYVRIWNQQNWQLSDIIELMVSKTNTGYELAQKILEKDNSIKIENMSAIKINVIWNFNKAQLLNDDVYIFLKNQIKYINFNNIKVV